MVSATSVKENGVEETCKLPHGKYRLVGFDLDLTGRRLIDEICHIAAYTPNSQFSQYVMPFRDLNIFSVKSHLLRVITVGRFRMLRSIQTGKILKTKSEISAVTDFVQWLESLKAENIILITHDQSKTIHLFLLEVIRKYKLYDRFTAVVKGFANSFVFAKEKCEKTVKSYNIYTLSNVLLDRQEDLHSASNRARVSYQIVQHLCTGEDDKGSGDASSSPEIDSPAMSEAIRLIANTVEDEEKKLAEFKELVERQNNLRPIFGHMFKSRNHHIRRHANILRRIIAQANLTYEELQEAWEKDEKESLTALVKERVTNTKNPENLEELIEILISHFDPEHFYEVPKKPWRGRKNNKAANKAAETGDAAKKTGEKESKTSSEKSSPGKVASPESSPVKADGGKADADTSR